MPIGGDEILQETFPLMALGVGHHAANLKLYWQILAFANRRR
jgi:hypothetical protein